MNTDEGQKWENMDAPLSSRKLQQPDQCIGLAAGDMGISHDPPVLSIHLKENTTDLPPSPHKSGKRKDTSHMRSARPLVADGFKIGKVSEADYKILLSGFSEGCEWGSGDGEGYALVREGN
jgi:hypothetical protein